MSPLLSKEFIIIFLIKDELDQVSLSVLSTYKFYKKSDIGVTRRNIDLFRLSRARISKVKSLVLFNYELIRDLMIGPVTSRNEEDPVKNEGA